jgi:hypothetical protein
MVESRKFLSCCCAGSLAWPLACLSSLTYLPTILPMDDDGAGTASQISSHGPGKTCEGKELSRSIVLERGNGKSASAKRVQSGQGQAKPRPILLRYRDRDETEQISRVRTKAASLGSSSVGWPPCTLCRRFPFWLVLGPLARRDRNEMGKKNGEFVRLLLGG